MGWREDLEQAKEQIKKVENYGRGLRGEEDYIERLEAYSGCIWAKMGRVRKMIEEREDALRARERQAKIPGG